MKIRYLGRLTVSLFLLISVFSCNSSPQKTDVDEKPVAEAEAEKTQSQPLTAQVEVTGGTIEGIEEDGMFKFKGIPFAAPPAGEMRWKAPAPVEPWEGVRKTDSFSDACMQTPNAMGNTAPVSEDCLYLNVWTPAEKADEKLPVIYWIHGGGYTGGSTSTPMYDGTGFAKKGVVMVSVAYRLGVFGYLAHPELSSESGNGSGTYGIQDMIYGLKWVKENISRFGGDPSSVTIFGHSAGGAAVSVLAASPAAKGLFDRVICMSGGSFGPLQTTKEGGVGLGMSSLEVAEEIGEDFLKQLGVTGINEARSMNAEDIQNKLDEGMGIRFRPVADGYIIPNDLYTLYVSGNFNYTPVLLGHTSDEAGTFGGNRNITPEEFETQIRMQYGPYADIILGNYPHSTDEEASRSARNLRNDSSFSWNTWTWSRLQAEKGKKAYQYYFDYHPDNPEGGSGHGSDVPFAFQTLGGGEEGPKQEDLKLSELISSYWTNFAKSGDPNGPGLPLWPSFTEEEPRVMVFDETPEAGPLPALERIRIFDGYITGIRELGEKK